MSKQKLSFPDQSSIAKWLIKEKKDIFETLWVPDFRWSMKNGDSSTCLACIVYNCGVNSHDDNKRLVMGKKNTVVVTSLHEKLFDLQAIRTS
jgi:hypothetical protein